jgi:hypothetical protein
MRSSRLPADLAPNRLTEAVAQAARRQEAVSST